MLQYENRRGEGAQKHMQNRNKSSIFYKVQQNLNDWKSNRIQEFALFTNNVACSFL